MRKWQLKPASKRPSGPLRHPLGLLSPPPSPLLPPRPRFGPQSTCLGPLLMYTSTLEPVSAAHRGLTRVAAGCVGGAEPRRRDWRTRGRTGPRRGGRQSRGGPVAVALYTAVHSVDH